MKSKDLCEGINVSLPKSLINWLRQYSHDTNEFASFHVKKALLDYRSKILKDEPMNNEKCATKQH